MTKTVEQAAIPSAEEFRKALSYNPETGILYWLSSRGRARAGDRAGTLSSHEPPYLEIKYLGRHYKAHRLAWLLAHSYWPANLDHKNGKSTDNRLSNLREATTSENNMNRKATADSAVGLKGVSLNKSGSFRAQIKINSKQHYLGTFSTAEAAHAAYCNAAPKLHGEFARTT
jgi:hypothetical protein